jgi:serine protease Do
MRPSALGWLLALVLLLPAHGGTPDRTPAALLSLAALNDSVQELVRKVRPSVVKVVAMGFLRQDDDSGEPGVVSRGQSSGSGVIIDPDGYIVTNAHVLSGADHAQVTLSAAALPRGAASRNPGRAKVLLARVVGFDSVADVALLKVPQTGLPHLRLADSSRIQQGEAVLAFGSPRGLEDSVTFGVVSSTARQFDPEDLIAYVQTDAPINPGSSGGPLVDAAGEVIGINTLFLSQSGGNEGLGFAVPSNLVSLVVDQLRRAGTVVHGDIGLQARTITPDLAAAWGLAEDSGVVVRDVDPDGPAEGAGIQPGDIIAAVDGEPMENLLQLNLKLYRAAVGSPLQLDIRRDGRRLGLALKVRASAPDAARVAANANKQSLVSQLGIFVMDIDRKLAAELGQSRGTGGVLVAATLAEAPAMGEDLKFGDVIYKVNRHRVSSARQLRELLNGMKSGEPIAFQIEREGQLHFVATEIP